MLALMMMREPTQRASRLFIASAVAVVTAIGAAGFLLGRQTAEPRVATNATLAPAPSPAPLPPTATVAENAVLGRTDLLALYGAGIDAFTAGAEPPAALMEAAGRRFDVALPFACGTIDQTPADPIQWRYDAEEEVLRVEVRPVALTVAEWAPPATQEGTVEAIEAFWIKRPWTASEACPLSTVAEQGTPDAPAAIVVEETLALAQFFNSDDARQSRRGDRPFALVQRKAQDDLNLSQGLRLRLSGRIAPGPARNPLVCRPPAQPFQRPVCALAVELGDVAIDNPASGETLATWNVGQDSRLND